jgi:HSP20 family molecular chaperone IbpA
LSISGFNDPFDIFFTGRSMSGPPTNIGYNNQEIILQISIPGYSRNDIDVDTSNGRLSIIAKAQKQGANHEFTTRDINTGEYKQSWSLPKSSNTENIEAIYESGILSIRIPYLQNSRDASRKIPVL